MSGGAFDYFYFSVEEAMLSHVAGLDRMITEVQITPEKYDPRTAGILKDIRAVVVAAQVAIHDANLVLHDIEWTASNDYGQGQLRKSINEYLNRKTS